MFSCEIFEIFKTRFFKYIFGNGKTFYPLSIFYYHDLAKCSLFLGWGPYHITCFYMIETSIIKALINNRILVQLFSLHSESKILTFLNTNGRPDNMLTSIYNYSMKSSCNKNIFYLKKKYDKNISYWIEIYFDWMKICFDMVKKKGDIMKISFIKYKTILIEWKLFSYHMNFNFCNISATI